MKNKGILIVDDERAARFGMKKALSKDGYMLYEAKNGTEALESVKLHKPRLVFLDVNMPGIDGLKVLEKIRETGTESVTSASPPLVVIITAYGSEKIAVEAMKKGAFDYIAKPFEIDELRIIVKNAFEKLALEEENAQLRSEINRLEAMGEIIGQSEIMKDVFNRIDKVGSTDVTVLIQGESGSGKELVAREIHRRSKRRDKPLIIMNCAALPETLIESELFGHERGAFTGATERRLGKFELAHEGTIFLDEIGDMSPNTQSKVLRVLQEQKFERLGGTETLKVDVRVISATHRDLMEEIKEGRFREDLYYRLKVVEIQLPPLRHRKDDIPLLANRFLQVFAEKHKKNVKLLSNDAAKALIKYNWPGNIRQLRNAIESAVVLAGGETLELHDLPDEINGRDAQMTSTIDINYMLPFKEAKRIAVECFERNFIKKRLEENNGNISRTAELLGMHRQSLQLKMRELNMK
ncbi:MAG TPA: sigma-54 dependent transcriptional regulator [Candidatus Brocadiales bacterium]|nr:sigma-54 dependent transcriptional regulator [Candidatus Brocadiales bacterium]